MSDRREDDHDMAALAWPGFVDILSAVIIMFVFFVMVIAVILYIHTIKFTATVQARTKQELQEQMNQQQVSTQSMEELQQQKRETLEEIEELTERKKEIEAEVESLEDSVVQMSAGLSNSGLQNFKEEDNEIVIFFDDNSITLNKDIIETLQTFLERQKNAGPIKSIIITAGDDPRAVTQSSARQVSLGRILNVRNVLLSEELEAERISIEYMKPEEIDGNYHWVRLQLIK